MKKLILIGLIAVMAITFVIAADWATNTYYNVGDQVTYNGKTYQCLQAHTSIAGWTPSAVPALWQEITVTTTTSTTTTSNIATTTTTLMTSNEWQVGVSYSVNQEVTYTGSTYICLQAHISQADWTPIATPALWQPKTTPNNNGSWQPLTSYNVGDKVTYNNINYVVRQAHTSQSDWTPDITPALFLTNVPTDYKDDLITKVEEKYGSQLEGWDIVDVDSSIKVISYTVTLHNQVSGETKEMTWLDVN